MKANAGEYQPRQPLPQLKIHALPPTNSRYRTWLTPPSGPRTAHSQLNRRPGSGTDTGGFGIELTPWSATESYLAR
ncbi:hypothetical protein GCM10011583_55080 [Streptomyces camponoticapitis]|uniref:Uncharacterized protein n=1 Tax=Streptomyces camponoticapitis TaxID=1616125 RepID=A0ABQ2ELC6_9ACTN|nr:hypothetical protein GCM10011583_55080 [Streptomyces camponoticapitis]